MAPSPALAAIGTDMLWCLGLGLLLGAARDAAGLLLGNGPLRCFAWDILAFAMAAVLLCGYAAGVSASGISRWYMALAMLGGALAWHGTVSEALHAVVRVLCACCLWPFRLLTRRCLLPLAVSLRRKMKSIYTLHLKRAKKDEKRAEKRKKQLQNPNRILYN